MATVVHLVVLRPLTPCSGHIAIVLSQERGKTMGIVCVYLVEILLELIMAMPRVCHIILITA